MARSTSRMPLPLGSLTQRDARSDVECATCSSSRVTQLKLNLTDGTPVDFMSCRACGNKQWSHHGVQLTVAEVLRHSEKRRVP
ncbi:MAG: hypothetical protein ACRCTR_06660 [Actinomycetota bacterium]